MKNINDLDLSDDQIEYQIIDRASFKRFLGLKKSNKVPDNKPLIEEQIANNKEKSRTRVRVEHLFGFVENSMNGSFIRTIGITRAKTKIGMMNLTYNICRCAQLKIVVAKG